MKKAIIIMIIICLSINLDVFGIGNAYAADWTQMDIPFGDSINDICFSMNARGGYIYAGTYTPAGGKLFRSSDGSNWTTITDDGFGDPNNVVIFPDLGFDWALIGLEKDNKAKDFNGYYYASTANENGLQIWRSANGTDWEQTVDDGFGDSNNYFSTTGTVFNDYLYAATINDNGLQVWRSGSGIDWESVTTDGFGDASNLYASSFNVFNDYLYINIANWDTGTEIWRSANGTDWEQANTDGFGTENNLSSQGTANLNNEFYVGTWNPAGGELWKTANGTDWTQITGLDFLRVENSGINPIMVDNGYMYLGTYNFMGLFITLKTLGKTLPNMDKIKISSTEGGEVWATNDGSNWTQMNDGGFGSENNVIATPSLILGDYLFAWTFGFDFDLTTVSNQLWRTTKLGVSSSTPTPTPTPIASASTLTTLPRTGAHKN